MKGVNKAILVGSVGNDPEIRASKDGNTVCNFNIATNEEWRDKNGDKQSRVEWHRIVVWGKLAEICGQYLTKGQAVYIEGKIQTRQWEKDGQKQYTTEIVASEMHMLGGKRDDAKPAPKGNRGKPDMVDLADDIDDGSIPF